MADIEKNETPEAVHVANVQGSQATGPNAIVDKSIVQGAAVRAEFDHQLSIKDAIKYYKWAILWTLALSMCVVMEGELLRCK